MRITIELKLLHMRAANNTVRGSKGIEVPFMVVEMCALHTCHRFNINHGITGHEYSILRQIFITSMENLHQVHNDDSD